MGQRIVLPGSHGRMPGEPIWKPLDDGLTELPHMKEIETIRALEGRMAIVYWDAFIGIPIQWDRKSVQKIPTHWQRITERVSTLSGRVNAQHATNPYQAVTNYASAVCCRFVPFSLNLKKRVKLVKMLMSKPRTGIIHGSKMYFSSHPPERLVIVADRKIVMIWMIMNRLR